MSFDYCRDSHRVLWPRGDLSKGWREINWCCVDYAECVAIYSKRVDLDKPSTLKIGIQRETLKP